MNPSPVAVPAAAVDKKLKQQRYLALFYQAQQRFNNYYLQYILDHQDDWPALNAEQTNLLAVAQYFREADDDPNLLRIRDALQSYLDVQGYWAESLSLNEWAIAAAQRRGDPLSTARFTHDRADILHQRGNYDQARRLYQASEQAYWQLGEAEMALKSRHMQALVLRAQGRRAEAKRLCESVITHAQRQGLYTWLAHPLYVKALLTRDRGNLGQARSCIEESLDRLAGSGELAMIAQCQHFLGDLAYRQGDLNRARAWLTESLRLSEEVGILRRVAATQWRLGDVARAEGKIAEADRLYAQAFELAVKLGDRPQQARILLSQSRLVAGLSKKETAIRYAHRALVLYEDIGDPRGKMYASSLLMRYYLRYGNLKLALNYGLKVLSDIWKTKLLWPRNVIDILKKAKIGKGDIGPSG